MNHVPDGNRLSNVERFSGFEDTYDRYRPEAPALIIDILTGYLGRTPSLVVDIGCGTGLSTMIWKDHADQIIGVEPNDDMRGKAERKLFDDTTRSNVSFISGYSNQLDLESASADIVTCSQSFHWMEPVSTLKEVSRILRPDGIFAAYDCDWPPTLNWELEQAYMELTNKADNIIAEVADSEEHAVKNDKGQHLTNLRQSGEFRFTKEIVFHNVEDCDAQRYSGLAISQGGVQTVLKMGTGVLDADIQRFCDQVSDHFQGRTLQILFSYRMRIGIK
ncbi:class I SAM-dependent methyltransferase [Paenibacillus pini]|uniref:Methyltransferase n=1 Tax=Paenibacillus pini JCM 16418 TaxID=1236976 RepID=W7YJM2_9BACL|nr:class I SAM-dependent methyltransferase [Paenibacillus pini]GAF07873.1 methyltransferase [Paenibacillus pini JCM 16418]